MSSEGRKIFASFLDRQAEEEQRFEFVSGATTEFVKSLIQGQGNNLKEDDVTSIVNLANLLAIKCYEKLTGKE